MPEPAMQIRYIGSPRGLSALMRALERAGLDPLNPPPSPSTLRWSDSVRFVVELPSHTRRDDVEVLVAPLQQHFDGAEFRLEEGTGAALS
jgi:hypothetical protein